MQNLGPPTYQMHGSDNDPVFSSHQNLRMNVANSFNVSASQKLA